VEGQAVEIHDRIFGWLYPEQMEWLAREAQRRYSILEVGAWEGKSADVLARATPGMLYVVDSWLPSTDPEDETSALDPLAAYGAYMREVGWRSNVVTYAMTSEQAYALAGHLTFDMIWLDADHREEAVREDILMWRSRLRPGGLLCGHDGEHGGVAAAVADLVPSARFHATQQPPPHQHQPSLIWYAEV
jgi:predicted O-methyltransferase YrrM